MAERVLVEELDTDKPRTRELKVTVTKEAVQEGLKRVARRIGREVRIPGFRPGRAPYPIVERYVGRDYLMREFLADELEGLVKEALNLVDIEQDVGINLVDVELEEPSFRVEVALPPRVELGDYKSVKVPYEEPEVTDEDVDALLAQVLHEYAEPVEVEGPARAGDEMDVIVSIAVGDETPVEEEEVVANAGTELYLPGIGERLVDLKVGDEVEFTVPVPGEHPWREHGDEARVRMKVVRIEREQIPELTLEMAQSLNPDVESPEELREIIRGNLQRRLHLEARAAQRQAIMEDLARQATVEIPPLLVEEILDDYIKQFKKFAESMGLTWEQYLKLLNKTEEDIRDENREAVEKELRYDLILDEIAKREGIEDVTEDAFTEIFSFYTLVGGEPPQELDKRMETDEQFRKQIVREAFRITVLNHLAQMDKLEEAAEDVKEAETAEASSEQDEPEPAGTEEPESVAKPAGQAESIPEEEVQQ